MMSHKSLSLDAIRYPILRLRRAIWQVSIELLAEVADKYGTTKKYALVQAGPRLLPMLDPQASAMAEDYVTSKNVQVFVDDRLKKAPVFGPVDGALFDNELTTYDTQKVPDGAFNTRPLLFFPSGPTPRPEPCPSPQVFCSSTLAPPRVTK